MSKGNDDKSLDPRPDKPLALSSRAIGGTPCLGCCEAVSRGLADDLERLGHRIRDFFNRIADGRQGDLAEGDVVEWDDVKGFGLLMDRPRHNPLEAVPPVIRPDTSGVPPESLPIKPWYRGLAWVKYSALVLDENPVDAQGFRRLGGGIANALAIAADAYRKRAPGEKLSGSCADCVQSSLWGQDRPQRKEVAVIRRRL